MNRTNISVVSIIFFLLAACAHSSKITEYHDYLVNNNTELSYDDIVAKLGEPEIYKEFEKDFVASWSSNYWGKSVIDSDLKGEKLIFTFDKVTKKMLKWDYKTW